MSSYEHVRDVCKASTASLEELRLALDKARQEVQEVQHTLEATRATAAKPLQQTVALTKAAKLASVQDLANQQRTTAELDRRIHDLQQVATVYGS